MDLTDDIRINAPRERVFAALNDPEILRQAIPGCEELNAASDTEYAAVVSSKVGPLKARFRGQVKLDDIKPPESYTLTGEGKGGPAGHAKIRAAVRLDEDGDATLMHYDVHADIGGKLAQLGGQLVQNTAKKLAGEFFTNFEALVAPPGDADDEENAGDKAAAKAAGSASNNAWWWLAAGAVALLAIALLAL